MKKTGIPSWIWRCLAACPTIWLSGCEVEIQCGKANIEVGYVGYTLPELDTIIIRRYVKPISAGYKMKDSAVMIQPDHIRYTLRGDTAEWTSKQKADQPFFSIESDYDYEVFIAAAGKTYLITDIVEKETNIKVPLKLIGGVGYGCMNQVRQIRMNGAPATLSDRHGSYIIYLKK